MCHLSQLTMESIQMTDEIRSLVSSIQREKSVEDVLEAIPFMVFIKDDKGNITDCNQKFCDVMGQPKERLLMQGWREYGRLTRQQMEQYFLNDIDVIETGKMKEIYEFLPNENSTPILTFKCPLKVQGKTRAVLAISMDISKIIEFAKGKGL